MINKSKRSKQGTPYYRQSIYTVVTGIKILFIYLIVYIWTFYNTSHSNSQLHQQNLNNLELQSYSCTKSTMLLDYSFQLVAPRNFERIRGTFFPMREKARKRKNREYDRHLSRFHWQPIW